MPALSTPNVHCRVDMKTRYLRKKIKEWLTLALGLLFWAGCFQREYFTTMPKELTHWILADRVYAELASGCPMKDMIANNRDYYLAGAVLPDTLMHLHRSPQSAIARELAHLFHDSKSNSYAPLIAAEKKFPEGLPDNLTACLLGIISHMQADIVFHPFVFNVAGIHDIGRHYRLETALDIYLIRRGAIPPVRHLRDLVTSANRADLINTCSLVFDPDGQLPRSVIEHAMNLHCRYQSRYNRLFWRWLARLVGCLPGSPLREMQQLFYPLNLADDDEMILKGKWQHPVSGEPQTISIEGLADQAVQRTVTVLEKIRQRGSLLSALTEPPGQNLLTGLYGTTQSEMRYGADTPALTSG